MHGTGQTGIKRADDPRGFHGVCRIGDRQADQRLFHRPRHIVVVPGEQFQVVGTTHW